MHYGFILSIFTWTTLWTTLALGTLRTYWPLLAIGTIAPIYPIAAIFAITPINARNSLGTLWPNWTLLAALAFY
jgi:hypothetical protein